MSSNPHSPHLGEVVDATDVVVSGLSARRSRVIVLLLAASVALMMTGFGIIFPIFAKRLGEFGSGVGALGIMTMSFALAQLLVAPLAGAAADRIGRKPIILVALVGFAVANIGFLFASSTWALVAVRAVEGAVTAGLMPATMGVVADIIPEERRAQWVGTVMASLGFGFIFGPVAGGLLYDAWGFEAPFIVSAALGAVRSSPRWRWCPKPERAMFGDERRWNNAGRHRLRRIGSRQFGSRSRHPRTSSRCC